MGLALDVQLIHTPSCQQRCRRTPRRDVDSVAARTDRALTAGKSGTRRRDAEIEERRRTQP